MAAFPQSNEGDVSPNTAGPRCIDTGEPCDLLTSACNGRVCQEYVVLQQCIFLYTCTGSKLHRIWSWRGHV